MNQTAAMRLAAQTIYEQLGGGRFRAMTGARDFLLGRNSLSFRLPKAKDGINHVSVTLNGEDLYDLSFCAIRGTSIREVQMNYGVFAGDLQRLFTEATGLHTRL